MSNGTVQAERIADRPLKLGTVQAERIADHLNPCRYFHVSECEGLYLKISFD